MPPTPRAKRAVNDPDAPDGGELVAPDGKRVMPARPKPPRTNAGREIEHGAISLGGGVAFELNTQPAIDYLAGFKVGDTVRLVVHGRVAAMGDSEQALKEGTLLTRRVRISIDQVDGAPNDEATAALAAIQATRDDDDAPNDGHGGALAAALTPDA